MMWISGRDSIAWKIGKNILRMVVLLVLVSLGAFLLVSASPIDPLQTNIGQTALGSISQEQIERLREYWGVGIPPLKRFFSWARGALRGDMGISLLYRQPVVQVIRVRFYNSLWMLGISWVLSGVLGVLLGVAAGAKKDSVWDRGISAWILLTASMPAFWLALVLLMVFSVWLKLLPIGFSVPAGVEAGQVTWTDRMVHAILPAAALSITGCSNIAMHTRQKLVEVMESDYVLFARARGDSAWRIVWQHGMRNILIPVVTLQFASISEIFGGSVLVEQVFSYPGLGQAAVTAGLGGDVPLLMGITVITAVIVFAGNMAADMVYTFVDPRIRRGRKAG